MTGQDHGAGKVLPASQVEGTKCDLIFLFYNPGQPGITDFIHLPEVGGTVVNVHLSLTT